MPEQQDSDIEVGAVGGDVRYWLAKETIRQAELRLTAQVQSIAAMEARATSILAWSAATMIALAAAASRGPLLAVAIASGTLLLAAAIACVAALWPKTWHPPGYDPRTLREAPADTELQILEHLAGGYQDAIDANERTTDRFGRCLRAAWILFMTAPIAGAAVAAIISA